MQGVLSLLWTGLAGHASEPPGGEGAAPHRLRRRLMSELPADNASAEVLSHPLVRRPQDLRNGRSLRAPAGAADPLSKKINIASRRPAAPQRVVSTGRATS